MSAIFTAVGKEKEAMATSLGECYELLGLAPDASEEDVRRAYRQKARECHPDKNPDDPKAKEKFQVLTQGYERIVAGSSATERDDEPAFYEFESFFHFVMFHEMMRRRMEEEIMARMFGGLFFNDSDDEDDIPFGFFNIPFSRRPRRHDSFARSSRRRYQENSRFQRSSYDRTEGPSAKPPKKEKRNPRSSAQGTTSGEYKRPSDRSRTSKPRNEDANINCNNTFNEETCRSKCGQNDLKTEREAHHEERAKQSKAPKPKQKTRSKGQMTSSEWQKGRRRKQNNRRRQNAKTAFKDKAEEPRLDSESETSDGGHKQRPRQAKDTKQEENYCDSDHDNYQDEPQMTAEEKFRSSSESELDDLD